MAEVCGRFSRHENVGIPLMGTIIHGPFLLADALASDTLSDHWMTFCEVLLGDGIWDGGGAPMLPGSSVGRLVMRYDGLLASMAAASGSIILVLWAGCWDCADMMIMDVDSKWVCWQTSIVLFRNKEVGIATIIGVCFNPHLIIKGPSYWFLDFGSSATNTYLWSMIHFQSVLITSFFLSSSWYIKYYMCLVPSVHN